MTRPSPRKPADTIEEIDWFLTFGIHPTHIANALQRTTGYLAKLCRRHGHNDWAQLFDNAT